MDRIKIVLVNTSHPGNIGGVARAMKNMGMNNLVLVDPQEFPSDKASARSSGATDILENATITATLEEAIADCQYVVGTSARQRHIPWPIVNPRQLVKQLTPVITDSNRSEKIAIVFGREDRGLTNEELHLCNSHVHIPSVESFSSLNLAAAVQVICYELRMTLLGHQDETNQPHWGTDWDIELANAEETNNMFQHLEQTLIDIEFLNPDNPRQLMTRLRRLFLRSRLDKVEVNVLRGILTAVNKSIGNK